MLLKDFIYVGNLKEDQKKKVNELLESFRTEEERSYWNTIKEASKKYN